MGYRGRHRAATSKAIKVARIAVGGLALAEITGGLGAIPAWACGHDSSHHSNHSNRSHHVAARPAKRTHVQPVAAVAPAPKPAPVQAPAPQPAPAATPDNLFTHYIVQPGDNLTYIAAAYGLPWDSLYAANADVIGDNPDLLLPGQRLRLPA